MDKNLAYNSLNAINLFTDNIVNSFRKEELILHVPHSSTHIPIEIGFVNDSIKLAELDLVTDWYTDEIFDLENVTKIVTPFSRIFCDVEKFDDKDEELFKFGRGYFYTHNGNGEVLRENDLKLKEIIFKEFYLNHHNKLINLVEEKLNKYSTAFIVDCHSFNDVPLNLDLNQNNNRPDICLGVNKYHTPLHILIYVQKYFADLGFSTSINSPYSNTMIPLKYLNKNNNVQGIMIEINKKIYLDSNNKPNLFKIKDLNKIISELFI